jgi:hypothetical protein
MMRLLNFTSGRIRDHYGATTHRHFDMTSLLLTPVLVIGNSELDYISKTALSAHPRLVA